MATALSTHSDGEMATAHSGGMPTALKWPLLSPHTLVKMATTNSSDMATLSGGNNTPYSTGENNLPEGRCVESSTTCSVSSMENVDSNKVNASFSFLGLEFLTFL